MTNQLTNSDIFHAMELWAPLNLAFDWDNVGLQVGSYSQPVKKVMVTLDVNEAVVKEAIKENVNLIIAHHPLLFRPMKQIDVHSPNGRTIYKLIKHDISVYAAHTNLDIAKNGVNDMLCDLLKLTNRENLVTLDHEKLYKFVVYVPLDYANDVRDAVSVVGAGWIGNYSHCTFQTKGEGTFKPLEGANPFIGSEKKLEKVKEVRMETIVKQKDLSKVILAMKQAHPYEEAAYDIFPMHNKGELIGLGKVGELTNSLPILRLCERIKETCNQTNIRLIGNKEKKVKRVAILGGSGEKYIHEAKRKNADVFITGDMTFHQAQEAIEFGLPVIDAGQYIESITKENVQSFLQKKFEGKIEVIVSNTNTDPFTYV